ncbi:hypothetical protein HMPREF9412_5437 [Paenibacillus sp. HGF5]|nr:hypothetical protein HMPREF9412_5437 [Paenibacillus sp. HGF5]
MIKRFRHVSGMKTHYFQIPGITQTWTLSIYIKKDAIRHPRSA